MSWDRSTDHDERRTRGWGGEINHSCLLSPLSAGVALLCQQSADVCTNGGARLLSSIEKKSNEVHAVSNTSISFEIVFSIRVMPNALSICCTKEHLLIVKPCVLPAIPAIRSGYTTGPEAVGQSDV